MEARTYFSVHFKDYEAIRDLLLGHKAELVDEITIQLDNDVEIFMDADEGWECCGEGVFVPAVVNGTEDVITNVCQKILKEIRTRGKISQTVVLESIIVYAKDRRSVLVSFQGEDNRRTHDVDNLLTIQIPANVSQETQEELNTWWATYSNCVCYPKRIDEVGMRELQ
jgi:hypothetical protein